MRHWTDLDIRIITSEVFPLDVNSNMIMPLHKTVSNPIKKFICPRPQYLFENFKHYKKNKSSQFIAASTIYIKETVTCINATLNIITSSFIISFLTINLIIVNTQIALIYFLILCLSYYLISKRTSSLLKKNSKKITN